ncbi:MAG TPA: GNAT family N-acetyltransferase, partial [Actinomycetaceae bacterium]|nr:GNAT family N-acetyltransferase [Actinomycetaceae bacterium]
GAFDRGRLLGMCWMGANLVPVALDSEPLLQTMAEYFRDRGRRCSSIVGPADQVHGLWQRLAGSWPRPREIRGNQPSMAISTTPQVAPDPDVRLSVVEDLDILVPACVAMFTEEVGYSPLVNGGAYAARVEELVHTRRSFIRTDTTSEGRRVVFKAEVGAMALGVAQVQGVWVHPELRGRGIAAAGMAAVVELVRAELAPTVSLYVNDFNAPALATYRRAGFTQVGTYATVLF